MAATTEEIEEAFGLYAISFETPQVADMVTALCAKHSETADDMALKFQSYFTSQGKAKPGSTKCISEKMVTAFAAKCLSYLKPEPEPSFPYSSPVVKRNTTNGPGSAFKTPHSANRYNTFSTPASNNRIKREFGDVASRLIFDDSSQQSGFTPYRDRRNAGEECISAGKLPVGMKWETLPKARKVHISPADESTYLKKPYSYMFFHMRDAALALTDRIDTIGSKIASELEIAKFTSPAQITTNAETVYTLGRLLPNENGGLFVADLIMQTSSASHQGIVSRLDLGMLESCQIFPGQIIVAKGYGNGKSFAVKELIPGVPLSGPPEVKARSPSLHLQIACGPFHILGDSPGQPGPLRDLLATLDETPADVLVLMGPFVDEAFVNSNPFIEAGIKIEDYFKSLVKYIFDEVVTKRNIHLVLMPSVGQLVEMPVYPLPPFQSDLLDSLDLTMETREKITFAPEPALLNINGVTIGLTSTDVLFDLNRRTECVGVRRTLDRMPEFLLTQQSFYPLYPPEIPADTAALCRHAQIPVQPHCLVTPSCLNQFIRDANGTLCMNPGKLSKGQAGGTYGRIFMNFGEDGKKPEYCAQVKRI